MQMLMRMATIVAVFGAAIAGGVAAARVLGSGRDGISREQAIAICAAGDSAPRSKAGLIAARSGRFDQFWYPGSTDFAVPPGQRVWAVAFGGTFSVSCGPPPPPGEQARCPRPPNTTMMIIINYRDGAFIEGAPPISGFEDTYPKGSAIGIGIIFADIGMSGWTCRTEGLIAKL